jgi:hypothetical protein
MADSAVEITAGTGTNVDTRTEATNGNHRQVIVVGDPSTNAGVAPVSATQGLGVNVASGGIASGAIASGAIASGALASGAVASGAIASGAIAAGAIAAGAASIAEDEDVASANGDRGVKVLAVRKATPANTSGTDGDYEFPQISAGSLWVASEATNKTLDAERVINGGAEYETVAASQTAQALGGTGATGDYLAGILVTPATTSPGTVIILDNAISITVFAGGASSVSNLVPFFIPLGLISVSGAWKITTGANVSCIGIGKFTA